MPRPNYPAELEELQVDLEALRYYRRHKLIKMTPQQYKAKVKKLQERIDFVEDKIHQEKEKKQKKAERLRKAQEKVQKAHEKQKKAFLDDLKQKFENDDEIRVPLNNTFMTDIDLFNFIIRQSDRWSLKVGDLYYTLNDLTKVRLNEYITNNLIASAQTTESDEEVVNNLQFVEYFDMVRIDRKHFYEPHHAAFFPYYHNTHFDFSRYAIYKNSQDANYETNCLIHALEMSGVEAKQIDLLKCKIKNRSVPIKYLKEIADILETKLVVKMLNDKNIGNHTYGKQYAKTIVLGLIENHYFLVEQTNITSFCINNYDAIKHLPNCHHFYNNRHQTDVSRCVSSYELVKCLVNNKEKLLREISIDDSLIATTQFYDKANMQLRNLEYDEQKCSKPMKYKEPKNDIKFKNVFFDFETYEKEGVHIPYLCRTYDGKQSNVYFGEECGLQMLRDLRENTRLIAHNATYDYRFIIKYLRNINEISRGNRLISCSAVFNKHYVQIKDSFHLISTALCKFPKMFNIPNIEKEIMPYSLYSEETVKQRYIPIQTALQIISPKDHEQFLDNLKRWNLRRPDETYDIVKYSSKYCEIDCKILFQGYNTFRKWILDLLALDIDNILTTASLADRYFIKQGCYEGVNELSGVPQMFIQGTVVGGRTMVSENKKIAVEGRINDFDAVSLYPSAMARMDGFLKGNPKVIQNLSYDWLKQQDGYFVDIHISSVGIRRKFPLMSAKNDAGVRMFTNDMVGKIIRVDKYTLEDLIQFHDIQFEIMRGYYFNEGFNTKINEVIMYLFNERLRLKKEGNSAEQVYKLLMNSGYGKSIMKPVETEVQFFDDEKEFEVYLSRNYNWIRDYIRFGNKIRCNKIKTLDEHYNRCHIGTCILSMSKRIMNEVMCLADDLKIDIFYQDTDSMHIRDVDIPILASSFKAKYSRELIGKRFGQFHSDFELVKELPDGKKFECENVVARRSIFLGKKCYIDELVGTDEKGEEHVGFHIRMKGIPNKVILYHAKKLGYATPFEMYQDLNSGKSIEFDLTNDGTKANFKFNKDYTINTLSSFPRKIQFATSLYNQTLKF